MINTLDDYICCSLRQWDIFTTNPNLRRKVDTDGNLLPYVGNTVVFLLDDEIKAKLHGLQKALYQAAPEMLAQPLQTDTFHMTLHDLVSGKPNQMILNDAMRYAQEQASQIISQWKNAPCLRMKATWLFNMVDTSIVLGLAPVDRESWQRLDEMYMALEEVVPLGYAMTPHITMAYFRPGTYQQEQVRKLAAAFQKVELRIALSMDDLVLQHFSDMNHYETIL